VKKIIFIIWLLSLSLLSSCIGKNPTSNDENPQSADENISQSQIADAEKTREEALQIAVQSKIEMMRKRLALKGLIIDWDAYYRDGQIALALVNYLEFYRKNPDDQLILEKLWDVYFNMNKYNSSYEYYSKIENPNDYHLNQMALSKIYDVNYDDLGEIKATQKFLRKNLENEEQAFYYINSLDCAIDFHNCKVSFNDYFWPETNENKNGTWTLTNFSKLTDIRISIENYRNFRVDQVYLKDAYIVASWYSNDLYSLSAYMWENILSYKPWYKPILKIVAQSYFQLWQYEKARATLLKYQAIDDEDDAVNYMLGIINTQMRDYVLANIYLSKAIDLGSPKSIEIRRQLIHNFYQLDNGVNILLEFQKLIENEENYTANDLWLGIYNHILEWDYETALSWAKLWMIKFPENWWNFYAYQAWILREQWQIEIADSLLKIWIEKYPENAFILINLWYTALAREEKWSAISYFKTVQRNFPNTEFALSAQKELDIISQ